MAVTIRPAVAADAVLIHGFIRALAEYEKLEAEMRATPADIARDLFGPTPRAFCDIAEADGAPRRLRPVVLQLLHLRGPARDLSGGPVRGA